MAQHAIVVLATRGRCFVRAVAEATATYCHLPPPPNQRRWIARRSKIGSTAPCGEHQLGAEIPAQLHASRSTTQEWAAAAPPPKLAAAPLHAGH
jgi:hypothetical protein